MFEILTIAIAVVLILAAWSQYRRTGDVLCPTLIFAPMLIYVYVYHPLVLFRAQKLNDFFPDINSLIYVQTINLTAILMFCLGMAWHRPIRSSAMRHFQILKSYDSERVRQSAYRLAVVLGVISNFVFWYTVYYSGGPIRVFSDRKPNLISPFRVGYIDELTLLSYPALLLMAVAFQGRGLRMQTALMAMFVASPHLVMGSLGGRRGPAFLILATLVALYVIARQRRLNYKWVIAGLACAGVFLLALNEHRGDLFRNAATEEVAATLSDALTGKQISQGDEYVAASAAILAADYNNKFFWGRRYVTLFLVRPIPSRIWPTKYDDMGMGWMVSRPGTAGFTTDEWIRSVGYEPAGGSAGGFVSDLFVEFSWFSLVACLLLGRVYANIWYRSLAHGGLWTLLYMEMLILSIYLPTQNVEAWLYRLMLIGVVTYLFWRYAIAPPQARRATVGVNAH